MGYKTRCASRTGIYHVMIRGINHENIFGKSLYKHVMKGIMNNKALTKINGEPLIERTIRLLKENGKERQ